MSADNRAETGGNRGTGQLVFTGERVTPAMFHTSSLFMEHFSRYIFAREFCIGKSVLDIGCGYGYGTKYLSGFARECLGIDISQEAIDYAQSRFGSAQCRYRTADCSQPLGIEGPFDTATCFELIEHLEEKNHNSCLQGITRVLRPEGKLIISTPNFLIHGQRNEYHRKEYAAEGFRAFLGSFFRDVRLFAQNKSDHALQHARHHKELNELRFIITNFHRLVVNKLLPGPLKLRYKPMIPISMEFGPGDYTIENFSDIDKSGYIIAVCSDPIAVG